MLMMMNGVNFSSIQLVLNYSQSSCRCVTPPFPSSEYMNNVVSSQKERIIIIENSVSDETNANTSDCTIMTIKVINYCFN